MTLSDSLPMLEHMGMQACSTSGRTGSRPRDAPPVWMHDLGLQSRDRRHRDRSRSRCTRCSRTRSRACSAARSRTTTSTASSSLARLPAVEIVVLRAYAKYLRQIGFPLSQSFVEATLAAHATIARDAGRAVQAALRSRMAAPARSRRRREQVRAIEAALEDVENLSEDRVLRQYLALILATTRTNYWVATPQARARAFCRSSSIRRRCPACRSRSRCSRSSSTRRASRACTCAAARVARGGLRWSDRPEDFRTEVLGLVKAQMVKNTVIVPVGSKGGFVLKRAPAGERPRGVHEGRRGLLPGLPARPARPHRQPRRRRDRPAAAT